MELKQFIKMFENRNEYTYVCLEWFWINEGIDEEYCFEGTPSEFIKHYTYEYDCIDGYNVEDCTQIRISNCGRKSMYIYIEIVCE